MGVQSVSNRVRAIDVMRAIQDRARLVEEVSLKLRRPRTETASMLNALERLGVARRVPPPLPLNPPRNEFTLTRGGRQLLEAHERRAESPVSVRLDWMMRRNLGACS